MKHDTRQREVTENQRHARGRSAGGGGGGVEGMLKRLRRYASRRAGCVRLYAEGDARNNAQSKKHRENLLRAKRVRS
jgi:hypothetical protein